MRDANWIAVPTRLLHAYYPHPAYQLARQFAEALRPFYGRMQHVLLDTLSVLQRLDAAAPLPPGGVLARVDATSMFHNMRLSAIMDLFRQAVRVPLRVGRALLEPAEAAQLCELLFQMPYGAAQTPAGDIVCCRLPGLPMGHPLSPFAAALLVSAALEAIPMRVPNIRIIGHYVDDVIVHAPTPDAVHEFTAVLGELTGLRWEPEVGRKVTLLGAQRWPCAAMAPWRRTRTAPRAW